MRLILWLLSYCFSFPYIQFNSSLLGRRKSKIVISFSPLFLSWIYLKPFYFPYATFLKRVARQVGGWWSKKTYVTLYRWGRPKKVVSSLLISRFSFLPFYFPNVLKISHSSISPTQVIGNSHCPLGTQDEKRGLIPKWINSTKVQSEPSLCLLP